MFIFIQERLYRHNQNVTNFSLEFWLWYVYKVWFEPWCTWNKSQVSKFFMMSIQSHKYSLNNPDSWPNSSVNEAAPWPLLLQQEHNDISPLTAPPPLEPFIQQWGIKHYLLLLLRYEPNLPSYGQPDDQKSASKLSKYWVSCTAQNKDIIFCHQKMRPK